MSTLFREFARDVLNVEPEVHPAPPLPSVFSAFLDEEKNEIDIKKLKTSAKSNSTANCGYAAET